MRWSVFEVNGDSINNNFCICIGLVHKQVAMKQKVWAVTLDWLSDSA